MKKILIFFINVYQKTLSPDHGWFSARFPSGYCKFQPDCSEYCKQAIEKKGVLAGTKLGFLRILRCNPWSRGGRDEV